MKKINLMLSLSFVTLFCYAASAQVTIVSDDLNSDSSSDYTVVNGGVSGGGDGSVSWAFDYAGLGIGTAPNTTDGSTTGVQVKVNTTANNGGSDETEAYTIFHNTEIVGVTDYTMTVDVYMGVWEPGADGSTEHIQIGVSGDGVTRNHLFELTSAGCCDFSGSGHYISISGDGGDSSDYRHWQDNANGSGNPGPVNQFDLSYLAPDMGTNVTSDNFIDFYEQVANLDAPIPGVIGNGWATVRVEVSQTEGKLRYAVRGATPETTGVPGANLPPEFLTIVETDIEDAEGFASFGLADLYSSVAPDSDNQYAIFDNFLIEGSNLPGGGDPDGDFNDDSAWDCADVNALTTEIAAGTNNADFDLNGDDVVDQADLAAWLVEGGAENPAATGGNPFLSSDANLDGSADVGDFNAWNANKFTNNSNFCSGDFNADGVVDVSDFGIWNAQKFTSSGAPSVVPEPASWTLLLIAGLALIRRKR